MMEDHINEQYQLKIITVTDNTLGLSPEPPDLDRIMQVEHSMALTVYKGVLLTGSKCRTDRFSCPVGWWRGLSSGGG